VTPTLDLTKLNDNQRDAVQWSGGALLVLAGPGSGKTRVLTLRVAKILLDHRDAPSRVLALTFTKKAAAEMRARVAALVPQAGSRARLSTFHGFAVDLLRQHGSHLGLRPEFRVVDDRSEQEEILAEAVLGTPGGRAPVAQLLQRIENLAERALDRDEVDAHCARIRDPGLAAAYRKYYGLLLKRQSLDFPGLILSAVTVLRRVPAVGALVRIVYPYVCFDEFQDTNEGQYRLLRELVGADHSRLFVVADDDQLIYRWRGASPERVQILRRDFSLPIIQLPTNYRCPPGVIEVANRLIVCNEGRSPGKAPLIADKTPRGDDVIRVREFDDLSAETEWVAEDIRSRRAVGTCTCAVLARRRKTVEMVVMTLRKLGIPAALVVRRDQPASAPVRWLHAILVLRHRGFERRQVAVACGAFEQLTGIRLDRAAIERDTQGIPEAVLPTLFEAALTGTDLTTETRDFMQKARSHLVDGARFIPFCHDSWPWFDHCRSRTAPGSVAFNEYEDERAAWHATQADILREFGARELSLGLFLQELSVGSRLPPTPVDVVQCMTIHGAKGLEFEHVYLMGLAEDLLPSYQAVREGDRSEAMEEERRSCFVAITRAEVSLTLSRATSYDDRTRAPSRFLAEMGVLGGCGGAGLSTSASPAHSGKSTRSSPG
jgi:DNA helicase-2/ATP-dependent DNA helicase PcrA